MHIKGKLSKWAQKHFGKKDRDETFSKGDKFHFLNIERQIETQSPDFHQSLYFGQSPGFCQCLDFN